MFGIFKKLTKKNDTQISEETTVMPEANIQDTDREKCIIKAMEKRDWTREEAEKEVENATKRMGITYKEYAGKLFYLFTPSEQECRLEYVRRLAAENKSVKKERIQLIIDRTGCSEEEAKEEYTKRNLCVWRTMLIRKINYDDAAAEVEKTIKALGIGYSEYNKCNLARFEPEEKRWAYTSFYEKQETNNKERDEKIAKLSETTELSKERILEMYEYAHENYGCSWKEFFRYRVYDLDENEFGNIAFSSVMYNVMSVYNRDKSLVRMGKSKELSNEFLKDYLKRRWCVNKDVTLDEFKTLFGDKEGVVYKPNYGRQGSGVEAIYINDNIEEVYNKVASYPRGVVEELIQQHPEMKKLNPSSVNCIRVFTIVSKNKPVLEDGTKREVGFASVKIGRGNTIADNITTGGMVANVDLETGTVITDAVDNEFNVMERHPDTGTVIKGFEIPYFKEAVALANRIIDEKNLSGTIGWDIAISETGPEIVEPNFGPSPSLLQDPYWPQGKGMRDFFERYLWDKK